MGKSNQSVPLSSSSSTPTAVSSVSVNTSGPHQMMDSPTPLIQPFDLPLFLAPMQFINDQFVSNNPQQQLQSTHCTGGYTNNDCSCQFHNNNNNGNVINDNGNHTNYFNQVDGYGNNFNASSTFLMDFDTEMEYQCDAQDYNNYIYG